MPGKLLRIVFALTSLAPIALVYGAGRLASRKASQCEVATWLGAVVVLCAAAFLIVRWVRRAVPVEQISVEGVRMADRDVLSFLLTYGLPLLALARPEELTINGAALVTFAAVVVLVLFQMNLMHVNPLLGVVGFHFFEVQTKSGNTYLLISRRGRAKRGELRVRRISEDLFMEGP